MDTSLLQSMFDAGGEHQLDARTYTIDAPLSAHRPVVLRGRLGTRIEAVAPVDQIVTVTARVVFEDIAFSGSGESFGSPRYARDGLRLVVAGFSTLRRVSASNCLRDGVHCAQGNNDSLLVEQCAFSGNGWLYATSPQPHSLPYMTRPAPAAVADGSALVCTPPEWVRPGCPVRIGTTKRVVLEVLADRLVLNGSVPADTSEWAVGVGCGWFEERSGDNNLGLFSLCLWRYNAEVGMACDGLYGHTVINGQFDYNAFYGSRVGLWGGSPVIGSSWQRPYFESNPSGSFLLGGAHDFVVTAPLHGEAGHYDMVSVPQVVRGVHLGSEQKLVGDARSSLPAVTVGDYWGGALHDGPAKYNARGAQLAAGVLTLPAAMCLSPGGEVVAISPPSDGFWREVTLVGGALPTVLVAGSSLILREPTVTLTQHQALRLAYIGGGRWTQA